MSKAIGRSTLPCRRRPTASSPFRYGAAATAKPGVSDDDCAEWWGQDSNLRRQSQRVYSPSPLTAREPHRAIGDSSDRCAGAAPCAAPSPRYDSDVAEPLRLGQRLELLERVVLDLADPLARHVERAADLLERVRAGAREPEAHLDRLALPRRERVQRAADVLLAQVRGGDVERR